jgi:hypothetical protein
MTPENDERGPQGTPSDHHVHHDVGSSLDDVAAVPEQLKRDAVPLRTRRQRYQQWLTAQRLPPTESGFRDPFTRFMEIAITIPTNPCGPTESVDTRDGTRLTCARRCRGACPYAEFMQGAA